MFDRFIEHDTDGSIKGLTLEWKCPKCDGMNFKILLKTLRESGQYHTRCRYCKAKFQVNYPVSTTEIEGEAEFMERLTKAEFFEDEEMDLIRDFAEIEYLKRDGVSQKAIREKLKLLEDKITFYKRRRRL
jgi:transcription elongation factor Elf1